MHVNYRKIFKYRNSISISNSIKNKATKWLLILQEMADMEIGRDFPEQMILEQNRKYLGRN